jgi:hypothetical protein
MSYFVKFPSENKPEWFLDRLADVKAENGYDTPWLWAWNKTYAQKVSVREGYINLEFENEQDYTYFLLRYS